MQETTSPQSVSRVSKLAANCKKELEDADYRCARGNQLATVALLRLATHEQDEQAWGALEQCFKPLMRAWLRRHPHVQGALNVRDEEETIITAFAEFRRVTLERRLVFSSLEAISRCLGACLNAVIGALARSRPVAEVYLPEQLYQRLAERERRIAYLLFHCGLKPADIMQACSSEFPDVNEIYRLGAAVMRQFHTITHTS
ncbi:hypothetical protein EI42_01362 [Thermosporothrix hazakensis]|jgi:non-ribosomal peptide synthetase component F|uniref:DNA-directed RNA polymerase specialized sigma24 family protein n=2 Tax=Thermosporothrix TaxID=768650 RepID=A0A326U9V1_THEHA|nr:hypothetical protein [Thermosporothrix hazakensis]PZW32820.1 hypothetical protein EI42_01362 [Thermosporothrix hazakensis]BBH90801.1 hypothetical protein KTC_55520 [Thermosporothrix sp. COM3]GCE48851.1 hypothetical protein KTH_37200 [Thermosporothrix hazakensis]